jgi:small subunit ribosomal protein S4e
MAKRGRSNHLKRLAAPKAVPVTDKKEHTWMISSTPGPHSKRASVPLMVMLRDVLKLAETAGEIKKMLAQRKISVDGKIVTDDGYPVGFMDTVSFADKVYRVQVDSKTRLVPVEIDAGDAKKKLMKVVGKTTVKGGKITLRLHDGRTLPGDNNVLVGDSLIVSVPEFKLEKVLKLAKGAKCLIREGKHAGTVATLQELIMRGEGKDNEAKLKGEFITVAKYLFVVDDGFKGVAQ